MSNGKEITSLRVADELFDCVGGIIERNGGNKADLTTHDLFDVFLHTMASYAVAHEKEFNQDYADYVKKKFDSFVEFHKNNPATDYLTKESIKDS